MAILIQTLIIDVMTTKKTCKEKRMLKQLKGVYKQCMEHLSPFNQKNICSKLENKIQTIKP